MLAHEVEDAVLAGIVDPEAVELCEEAGVGAEVQFAVGGKIDNVFCKPLPIEATVIRIKHLDEDGKQTAAVLQVEGVTLVLFNWTTAYTDPAHFRQVDIDPLAHKIVVVKEGYLFQGLRDIAPHAIMALTPGFANQIMEDLEYIQLRRPIYPLDPEMTWTAENIAVQ